MLSDVIRERGPMTVAAFMDLALYDPSFGYYARSTRRSGAAGDFFTSVDVGALFGELLRELARRGVVSVFLEGGPTLAGSFLAHGLVDRVVTYLAPALLGSGAAALGDAGVRTIAGIHRLAFDDVSPVGPDLRLTARPLPPHPCEEE